MQNRNINNAFWGVNFGQLLAHFRHQCLSIVNRKGLDSDGLTAISPNTSFTASVQMNFYMCVYLKIKALYLFIVKHKNHSFGSIFR